MRNRGLLAAAVLATAACSPAFTPSGPHAQPPLSGSTWGCFTASDEVAKKDGLGRVQANLDVRVDWCREKVNGSWVVRSMNAICGAHGGYMGEVDDCEDVFSAANRRTRYGSLDWDLGWRGVEYDADLNVVLDAKTNVLTGEWSLG